MAQSIFPRTMIRASLFLSGQRSPRVEVLDIVTIQLGFLVVFGCRRVQRDQPIENDHSSLSEFLTQLFAAATATIRLVRRQKKKIKKKKTSPDAVESSRSS